jgi:hypothetical protein
MLVSISVPDPHVFGPPGSGSFYQQDRCMDPDPDPDPSISNKNSKKNLDSYFLWLLLDILSLKNDVLVPSKVKSGKTF